ncbi:brefeldin A-inhibited guanine nucleotide-exchange protein 3 [Phlebotomus argentipes]|uniref:brefeldin A-inhibited guanine nucleotide-exchange protein 3 n=1 Tax=Phlebotomus argentipes TaxID=94469 RepID=UPI002892E1B4|nr:brefeldin A-inhibited guanine nucleotide-exchange protein 3 [Phlebotomus argentipes]
MEELFLNLVKEATGTKLAYLKQAAQCAHDKLYRQHGIHRDPSYDLRSVCLAPLQMALETRRPKFVTLALNGMHRVIRDERFYIGLEPEDDSLWLPAQLLRATANVTTAQSNEDTLVHVLRLFLAMACSPTCTLNGRLLIEILCRCGENWENGTRAVRAASLAAASQCLRTFSAFLKDETEEIMRTAPGALVTASQAAAVYNEVIPVMQWLCSRLVEPRVSGSPKRTESNGTLFLTECILTLTISLPRDVQSNPHFTAFLWQKFCPTLAASLGSPGRVNLDKKFTYRDALHIIESETRGFFTGPGLDGPQARCVYLTAIQLLRIAGTQGSLRPMLEALFHRMLLLPASQNRTEPLRCVREIFKSPERLVDLAVILFPDKTQGQSCSDDMALFRLIIDAMEECANATQSGGCSEAALQSSVECVVALLGSLQVLSSSDVNETILSNQAMETINSRYSHLTEVDYTGPLTYQSMARLPAPYRDAVAVLRQNGFETSSASDSDVENVEADVASNNSGDTEGPEEEPQTSGDEISGDSNWPYSYLEAPTPVRSDGDIDRRHAREFAKQLTNELVPKLLLLRSSVEVDEAMQEFASSICQQNSYNFSDFDYNLTVINADGIYLATYSALLLSLQLTRAGHYDNTDGNIMIPLSEQQFVTSVQNAGVLVYLSSAWLCELYQCILVTNPLVSLKTTDTDQFYCALVDMLCDAGGWGPTQMLSDWQRLQTVAKLQPELSERQIASKKLARRLLTCCWDSMVTVLTAGLGDIEEFKKNRLVVLSKKTLRTRRKQRNDGETLYATSLDGLHAAATLSNSLNLQHLSGKILNLIAANVCQSHGPRVPANQALSMDVILSGGLELGSFSADCWLPVFSVCRHVAQMEHELFSLQNSGTNINGPSAMASKDGENSDNRSGMNAGTGADKLNLSACPIDDDETCVDVYSFLQAPLQNSNTSVSSILKNYSGNEPALLTQTDTAKVLCALSHQADNLFSDAAERLSLPALCQFLRSLCKASREQLYRNSSGKSGRKSWWPSRSNWKQLPDSYPLSLLLHRVGDVTLRVFRGPRPLLHILKVWAITGPHLMDAACHKDRTISKRAIEYIHDVITALLVEQTELPHFHFNEALLKPFENLLSMETCDIDVQDQIVACLYEIVEAHRTEIRSGWRPLFGTLRNARNRPLHLSNVTDIFRVFLDSDNMLVFANAGLDCILCLLSYLEISGTAAGSEDDTIRPTDFLHETLKFLERCSSILAFMYTMPKCPNLHSTYKIKGISYTHVIDANIPNSMENFTYFGNDYLQNNNEKHMISYRSLHIDKESVVKIDELDKASGVLKVWFLLLDGLTNSLIVCPTSHQSPILQCIFKLFKLLLVSPGIDFGFYCINHLLIPMIQDWLRYVNKTQRSWQPIEKNFKHCCGMATDLIVEFIEKSQRKAPATTIHAKMTNIQRPVDNLRYGQLRTKGECSSSSDETTSSESPTKIPAPATLALKQLLLVLIECTAQVQESIARVGVSCLKHVILSTGHIFNEDQWMIACSAIHRACTVTIAPLRQLGFAFNEKSNSFYGDCATVKVAARKDSTIDELQRIYALAQQVFLMDNQRELLASKPSYEGKHIMDERSYSFLLYPLPNGYGHNIDNFVIRIPYRNLVIGLLANQMLLQLVANLLLSKLKCVPPEVHGCIFEGYPANVKAEYDLGFRSREMLLRCIKQYITSAFEFDSRPGLKFLMQKVSNIDFAANLYKQMISSWMVYFISLVDSYLADIEVYNLTTEDLLYILESCSRVNTTTVKKKENFVRYLFCLQDAWNLICEQYLNQSNLHATKSTKEEIKDFDRGEEDQVDFCGAEKIDEEAEKEITGHSNNPFHDNYREDSEAEESRSEKIRPEESVGGSSPGSTSSRHQPPPKRMNPFDINRSPSADGSSMSFSSESINQAVSPEIEQQRATSILRDSVYKRAAITQLVIASMELLKSLPEESSEKLKVLLTPTIREAFRLVKAQGREVKVEQV